MQDVNEWARRWDIPEEALEDLINSLNPPDLGGEPGTWIKTEKDLQDYTRMMVSQRGGRVWRNNNGAMYDKNGRFIRFGLANDSNQVNKKVKSSDLIGITPHRVTPEDVGKKLGLFTSYEVKKPGWLYRGNDREVAQATWLTLVYCFGGIAKFISGSEDLK